jgi:hypothetical protein
MSACDTKETHWQDTPSICCQCDEALDLLSCPHHRPAHHHQLLLLLLLLLLVLLLLLHGLQVPSCAQTL